MFMSAGFIYVLLAKTTPLDLLYTPHHGVAQLCHLIFFLTTLFRRNEIDYILETINYPDSNNYTGQ